MEPVDENQTSPDPNALTPPEEEISKDTLGLWENFRKEGWFGAWNYFLFMSTLIVDNPQIDGVRPAPTHTEGPMAFFEQNMAGSMEVLAMFYLARVPVELVARGIEIMADKKVDPRIKVGVSVLLAVITSSALELMKRPSGESLHGGVPDLMDALGNVAAGLYVGVGHQAIDYLFKPRETPLFDQWSERALKATKSIKEGNEKLWSRVDKWVQERHQPLIKDTLQTLNVDEDIEPPEDINR